MSDHTQPENVFVSTSFEPAEVERLRTEVTRRGLNFIYHGDWLIQPAFAAQRQEYQCDQKAGQQGTEGNIPTILGDFDGEEAKPGDDQSAKDVGPGGRDIEKPPK